MDDETLFDPVAHQLWFRQAVDLDVLTDYELVAVLWSVRALVSCSVATRAPPTVASWPCRFGRVHARIAQTS